MWGSDTEIMEPQKLVWEGAIPLQIHLHESQITTIPPPPPALVLAPRLGYLPLLASQIKPHFSGTLPPGADTIWFEYKGLPLKWYIPTGVLFDILCAEPERPWNLTVHFRGYPVNLLLPCEGEDSVKWNFINSLKEAAYIINGNCKNVMNMSQADQVELWRSVLNGNFEAYTRVSSKLKLGLIADEFTTKMGTPSLRPRQGLDETDVSSQDKGGRVPVRLYVWSVGEDIDDLEDPPHIDSWDKIAYINQPVEIQEGKYFCLRDAVRSLLPDYFQENSSTIEESLAVKGKEEQIYSSKDGRDDIVCEHEESFRESGNAEIKLVRVQGIEPKLDIPFSWVANNLMNPDYFLHICICLKIHRANTICR